MRLFAALFVSSFCAAIAFAAPNYPVLTGRVVDNAHLLSPQAKHSLEADLAQQEASTTNQLVVVTVPTLGGLEIEEYGYKLGRQWGIGQKGKDNGVLLIVAPKERAVRIEVGYGLEGVLTDAVTSQIIQTAILPAFKQGNMEAGILNGVAAIKKRLAGESLGPDATGLSSQSSAPDNQAMEGWEGFIPIYVIIQFVVGFGLKIICGIAVMVTRMRGTAYDSSDFLKSRFPNGGLAILLWVLFPLALIIAFAKQVSGGSSGGGFGGGSSSSSGSSFSGGGGSFGGGGSSGRW